MTTATPAPTVVSIEFIDPATARIAENVRTTPLLPAEFVDSIRTEGVREPVLAGRDADGIVIVYDGQRRLLAAQEAALSTIPAVFGLASESDRTAERIIDQLRTFARDDLTTIDRIAAYQQLALDGITVASIARKTGARKDMVENALTVAASPTASKAAAEYGQQLTLDRLVAIAEFDGDEHAAQRLAECDDHDLAYFTQRLRDERAIAVREAELIAQYEAEGLTVVTEFNDSRRVTSLTDADDDAVDRPALTPEDHAGCPGRAVYLRVWSAEDDDYNLDDVCTRPELHHDRYGNGSRSTTAPRNESDEDRAAREEAEKESKRVERSRVIVNNKAWRTAATVRRTWVTTFLARKTLPKDATVFIATSLAEHVNSLTEYQAASHVAAFLGLDSPTHTRSSTTKILQTNPNRAGHVALGVVLSAREARADGVDSWRSKNPVVGNYLLALEAWGYHLSPVERIAAGYPEQNGDAAA